MIYFELIYIIFSLVFLWKLTKCEIFPSPQFVLALAYFGYIYLGTLLMLEDDYYKNLDQITDVTLMVRLGWISILAASVFTFKFDVINGITDRITYKYFESDRTGVRILSLICLTISLIYILKIPSHPLTLIFTNTNDVAIARESATVGMKGFDVYSNFLYNLMPFCWIYFYLTGKNRFWIFVLIVNLFASLATGQKSPIIFLLISYIIAKRFKFGRTNYASIVIIFFTAILTLVILVYLQNKHLFDSLNLDALTSSGAALYRRFFMVGPGTLLNYFQVFPNIHDFLFFGGGHLPSDQIVHNEIYGDEIRGTVNSISLALFYAYTGNIYLSNLIFVFILIIVFILPNLIVKLVVDRASVHAAISLYYILLVKMVITDWYTILPIFILNIMVIAGFLNLVFYLKFVKFSANRGLRVSMPSFVISFLMLAYFTQGQFKILFAS